MSFIKFIAYGDIHHDRKAARCLTLKDTLEIERQVHQRVIDGDFNFSVCVGDRFLKREPEDEVKVKADRALREFLKARPLKPHFHLIGNHDWTKNNREWHTSQSLKGLSNLIVIDEATTIQAGTVSCMIHALPADAAFDMENYKPKPNFFNLFLFHGIIQGSLMADNSDNTFNSGIELSQLDRAEWDLVLGGDIHVPQKIPFVNTQGGYTGSVLQRTRADADKQRGWLEIQVSREDDGDGWNVVTQFVPTRNFFHKEIWSVESKSQYGEVEVDERFVNDQAVEITLIGKRKDVDRIADDPRWENYIDLLGARSIEKIRDYQAEAGEAVVDMSSSSGVLDDLKLYLDSGFGDPGALSSDALFEMVTRMQMLEDS